jgi:hypothetical protein
MGFGGLEHGVTDVALIQALVVCSVSSGRTIVDRWMEFLVSAQEPIDEVMHRSEGGRLCELGVATVFTGVWCAAHAPDDTFAHALAALRAVPSFRHTGIFVCGCLRCVAISHTSGEQSHLS